MISEKKEYIFKGPYPYTAIYRNNTKLQVIFLEKNYCLVTKTDPWYESDGYVNDWSIGTLHIIGEEVFYKPKKTNKE